MKKIQLEDNEVVYCKYYAGMLSLVVCAVGDYLVCTTNVSFLKKLIQYRFELTTGGPGKSPHPIISTVSTYKKGGKGLQDDADFISAYKELRGSSGDIGFYYQRYRKVPLGVVGGVTGIVLARAIRRVVMPFVNEEATVIDRTQVLATLRAVGNGIVQFKRRTGRLPSSLGELFYTEKINPGIFDIDIAKIRLLAIQGRSYKEPLLYYPLQSGDLAVLYSNGMVRIHAPRSDGYVLAREARVVSQGLGSPGAYPAQENAGETVVMMVRSAVRECIASIDFTLFPSLDNFTSPRSSSMGIIRIGEEGDTLRADFHIGHLLTAANQLWYTLFLSPEWLKILK